MSDDDDYVLGTEQDEIERLGLQHRVWRARMLDAWRRAGIGIGQTVIDVGAGPGYASADLAEIVGPGGRVVALERSQRFLEALEDRARRLKLGNIEAREHDVCAQSFGEDVADAAWCRWLLSFVAEPQRTVCHIARALKPGGVAVFHEYADYGAWQMMPRDPDVDRFRDLVMLSWREAGGEPDVCLSLPQWLAAERLEVAEVRPLIEIVGRGDFAWQWPAAFMATNARRLRELGYVGEEEAHRLATALERVPAGALMVTPLVVEIVARKL
jgi:SAM-dependent methyltransferase